MDIQLIEFAMIIQNANAGEYQALSLGWSGDVDPDGDLYSLLYTKVGFNFPKYTSAQFDKLLDDGRQNLDQAKRAQIYMDAQKTLLDDQPMIVLHNPPLCRRRQFSPNYMRRSQSAIAWPISWGESS